MDDRIILEIVGRQHYLKSGGLQQYMCIVLSDREPAQTFLIFPTCTYILSTSSVKRYLRVVEIKRLFWTFDFWKSTSLLLLLLISTGIIDNER